MVVVCVVAALGLRGQHTTKLTAATTPANSPLQVAAQPVGASLPRATIRARPAIRRKVPAEQTDPCLTAVAAQSDPAKLSTLGTRAANPRLKRIVYWLAVARDQGRSPADVIDQAQLANGSASTPRAALVKTALLRNLKIADGLGLLTPENQELMRRGNAPRVTRGPYSGEPIEVDHIVPYSVAPEIGNELANLEMLPRSLNQRKKAKVGERQLAVAQQMQNAGLLSTATMARVQAAFRPASTENVELKE